MSDNQIKLSNETVSYLVKMFSINQSVKIVANTKELRSIAQNRSTAVQTLIEEDFPRTFCVYDVSEFVSILKIIKDPILDFSSDKYVVIQSEDGSQKLRYMDADERLVGNCYYEKDLKLPSVDIDVQPTADQHKAVLDAARKLKLDYIGFKADGESLFYTAFAKNNGDNNETNTFSIKIADIDQKFNMFYKTEALFVLEGSPHFQISFQKISKVECDNYTFFIALDVDSVTA